MIETTVGRLGGRLLQPPRPASQEVLKSRSDDEDMGELSDSTSSGPSNSRPTTPNEGLLIGRPSTQSIDKHLRSNSNPSLVVPSTADPRLSEDTVPARRSMDSDGPYGVARKAQTLLGLQPGTLQHARVSLEYARDEVRRLASAPQTRYVPWTGGKKPEDDDGASVHSTSGSEKRGLRERARRTLSISFHPQAQAAQARMENAAVPNVVIGVGGAEEEEMRERRRKVADGVLYWQKQVARLEQEEQDEVKMSRKKSSGRGMVRRR